MVAMPAASARGAGAAAAPGGRGPELESVQPTPPPVSAPPVAAGAAPPAAGPVKATGAAAFRETLWFKQGDVDQMVADARAKLEASRGAKGAPAPEPEPLPAETKPLDERYRDDGSISPEDRKKYSLRQGATSASLPTVGGAVPGERMSAEEMMGEIGGGKRTVIVVVAVLVVAAVVAVVALGFRGRKVARNAEALTPVTVPTQVAAPAPPPAPPPPPAPAAAAPRPPGARGRGGRGGRGARAGCPQGPRLVAQARRQALQGQAPPLTGGGQSRGSTVRAMAAVTSSIEPEASRITVFGAWAASSR
jgi:hypothetical protein